MNYTWGYNLLIPSISKIYFSTLFNLHIKIILPHPQFQSKLPTPGSKLLCAIAENLDFQRREIKCVVIRAGRSTQKYT